MPGPLWSTVCSWWVRFLNRAGRGRAQEIRSPVRPVLPKGAISKAVATPAPSPVSTREEKEAAAALTQKETAQSFLEMLKLDALPVVAPRTTAASPAIRERTLAAVSGLQQIPALQSLAQSFVRTANRAEVSIDEVIASIEKDSALCVRVLQLANSTFVSPERRIEDLNSAVQMLGVVRVRRMAQVLFTLRDAHRVAVGFDWRHLWIHAFATAAIAEHLEKQFRPEGESHLYLAALLHDVGKIVLSTIAPDAYRDILVATWNGNGRLEELERERLGMDHREAGVIFVQRNKLPEVVVEAIAHHDHPEKATKHRFEVALVSLANYVSKIHGLGFSGARLDASDGEFEEMPAWQVVAEECGYVPDPQEVEEGLRPFLAALRVELRNLRGTG